MSGGSCAGSGGSGVSEIISGARPCCDAPPHRQDGLAGGASAFLRIRSPSVTFVVVAAFGASFVLLRRLFGSPERKPSRREARRVCSKCGASISGSGIVERRGSNAILLEEIINLHGLCNGYHTGSNYSGIGELLAGDDYDLSFSGALGGSVALYSVLFMLLLFYVLFKYGGNFLKIENAFKTSKNREVVPLKKRIAYKADALFSVYYAKLLALILATMLLIGFGGLALHAVSDNSLLEAFWLSWTFLVQPGTHADQVGFGPRVVSIVISSGGMMIFALMLGLVSDAISEKVDSVRKGKSGVIEMDHILVCLDGVTNWDHF